MSNVVNLHPEMSDTEHDLIAALNDAEYLDEVSSVLVFEYEHFIEDVEFVSEELNMENVYEYPVRCI